MIATVLLTVTDPADDVRGDGSYSLPPALVGGIERSIDLRELRAEDNRGRLRIVIGMGGLDNPWNAPLGFSAAMIDVFVKTDYGGQKSLGTTGFTVPPGEGWHRHYQVNGFGSRAWAADARGDVRELPDGPRVTVRGSAVTIDTDLPAGRYGYWATSRVYSPLAPGGALTPHAGAANDAQLAAARPGQPGAVDVLFAGDQRGLYSARVLPPVGELRDRRPIALLLLGAAGLLMSIFATFRAWRRS